MDNRNPIVLCNDGEYDNWAGEYAALFAGSGVLTIAGIVIGTGANDATNLDNNIAEWQGMVAAARASGLRSIPDPIASNGSPLVRPADGKIDTTSPNRSAGAQFIIDTSARLSEPYRPLVIVTGGRLTDIADAYLMDHSLPERVVVVSSLGTTTANGAQMGPPNGEMDKWADVIVTQSFRYVQISSYYDQLTDVSDALIAQSPQNEFTSWIQDKRTKVYNDDLAADQVAVAAMAVPEFVSTTVRAQPNDPTSDGAVTLSTDPNGPAWLVTQINGAVASARFSEMLLDPNTFRTQ